MEGVHWRQRQRRLTLVQVTNSAVGRHVGLLGILGNTFQLAIACTIIVTIIIINRSSSSSSCSCRDTKFHVASRWYSSEPKQSRHTHFGC